MSRKFGLHGSFALAVTLASVHGAGIAQEPEAAKPAWLEVAAEVASFDLEEATPAVVASFAGRMAAALDRPEEASALRSLAGMLGAVDDWQEISKTQRREIRGYVAAGRRSGVLQCLAPAVLALQRIDPADATANLALHDVYTPDEHVQNVVGGIGALRRLHHALFSRSDDLDSRAEEFATFLGIGSDVVLGLISGIALKTKLEVLLGLEGEGRRPRVLTPEEIEVLVHFDALYHALREGKQADALSTLKKLATLRPNDPLIPLLAGEVYASLGPVWNKDLARKELNAFLKLTKIDPAQGHEPLAWSFEELRAYYRVFSGEDMKSTRAMRRHAEDLVARLGKSPVQKLLIHANYASLDTETRKLESDLEKVREKVRTQEAAVEDGERAVQVAKRKLEDAKRRPMRPGQRFSDEVSVCSQNLQTANQNLKKRRKELEKHETAQSELQDQLTRYRARLRKFEAARQG